MKQILAMTVIGASLVGCANLNLGGTGAGNAIPDAVIDAPLGVATSELRPIVRPEGAPTVAEPVAGQSGSLGVTVASLGTPAETGLWLKTPLVKAQQTGSVAYNGKTARVLLIPIVGEATAGSRMSLQAFQALGAPLTDLVSVKVTG
ncbi:MAG: hypothetical protein QMB38_11305 [Ascidiaceihabitans sp.]